MHYMLSTYTSFVQNKLYFNIVFIVQNVAVYKNYALCCGKWKGGEELRLKDGEKSRAHLAW